MNSKEVLLLIRLNDDNLTAKHCYFCCLRPPYVDETKSFNMINTLQNINV